MFVDAIQWSPLYFGTDLLPGLSWVLKIKIILTVSADPHMDFWWWSFVYSKSIWNKHVIEVQPLHVGIWIIQFFEYIVILSLHVQDPGHHLWRWLNIHGVWTDLSKGRNYCSELLCTNFLLIDLSGRVEEKNLENWYQFTLPSQTHKIKISSDTFVLIHSGSYVLVKKTPNFWPLNELLTALV